MFSYLGKYRELKESVSVLDTPTSKVLLFLLIFVRAPDKIFSPPFWNFPEKSLNHPTVNVNHPKIKLLITLITFIL